MRRKVVQHGPSTMTLSLPSKWIREHGIKKGDEIIVTEKDRGLFITTKKGRCFEKKEVDISDLDELIPQVVASLYKRGYDEIVINFSRAYQLERVREILNMGCVGFEIVKETAKSVVIRQVSELSNEEFRIIFRRLFYFLISVAEDGLVAAKMHDIEMYNKLVLRDQSINKLADFCRRVVNKRGQNEYACETAIYHTVEQIEKIGDLYKDMNIAFAKRTTSPSEKTIKMYAEVNSLLKRYEELFFTFDLKQMEEFSAQCNKVFHSNNADTDSINIIKNIARELYNLRGPMLMLHL